MDLRARRVHIVGSADPECDEGKLVYVHAIVRELATCLARSGAGFILPFGGEPRLRDRDDGPALIFDWTVAEAVGEALSSGVAVALTTDGPLLATIATSKTNEKIPPSRRQLYATIRATNCIQFEFLAPGWTAGAVVRERLSQLGDFMIGVSGGEGVEHLAKAYSAKGKPVIPLDIQAGASQRDGSGGASRLFERALANPTDFYSVLGTASAADLLDRTRTNDCQRPVAEVVADIMALLIALAPPQVFYVRLLNEEISEFEQVESYFRGPVDPFVRSMGYQPMEMGIGKKEHAWMNQSIFDLLHHSQVVMVDLTTLRPNCFVELGYALGNKQRVLVSALHGTQLPFDSVAIEALFWKETESGDDRLAKLKKHWQRNINRPPLVRPREAQ